MPIERERRGVPLNIDTVGEGHGCDAGVWGM